MTTQEVLVLATGAAIAAPFIALATTMIQMLMKFFVGMIFTSKELKDSTSEVILFYLKNHARHWNVGKERYLTLWVYLKKYSGKRPVVYRSIRESQYLFWYHGRPILLTPATYKDDKEESPAKITYLRWSIPIEKLITEANVYHIAMFNAVHCKEQRFRVFKLFGSTGKNNGNKDGTSSTVEAPLAPIPGLENQDWSRIPVGWASEEIGKIPKPLPGFKNLSLTPQAGQIIKDVGFWYANKNWYTNRGVPWKRGYLLHGKPGTGKTSLVRAIGEELDLPIYVMDLATMTNKELDSQWSRAIGGSPCIILIEDIDGIFNGRDSTVNNELTFDAVLNAIDGVERRDGVLLFITTNHIEKVDPALGQQTAEGASRPGRIDVVAELPPLDHAGRVKLARRILQNDVAAEGLAKAHPDCTAAQFQEICTQEALHHFWTKKEEAA